MPKLILGTANFSGDYGLKKGRFFKTEIRNKLPAILKKNKIIHIDTALDYKNSSNLLRSLKIKNPKITTKIKLPNKNKNIFLNNLKRKIYKQLKDLGISQFEAILIHNTNDLFSNFGPKLLKVFNDLKFEKKTKMIGISVYSDKEIKKVMKIFKVDIIQFPLNIFNTSFVTKKWIKYFKINNIRIQVRSIFLQGLLLNTSQSNDQLKLNHNLKRHLTKFNNWIDKTKINRIFLNTQFLKRYFNMIDYIILGVDNHSQLLQNIKFLKLKKKFRISLKKFSSFNKNIIDPRAW